MANIQRNSRTREWDPFALTRNVFGFDPFRFELARPAKQANFVPQFEVKETDEAFILLADLPGVKQDDIEMQLDKNRLTISGSREAEERKEGESYHLYERSYGNFARTFALPENVDADKIEANLADGVLKVTLPKVAEAKPRKISIK